MGYSVGDKVEVYAPGNKYPKKIWLLWLTEIIPMRHKTDDQIWCAKFTKASHSTLIQESWIVRKISSNFEGFFPREKVNEI